MQLSALAERVSALDVEVSENPDYQKQLRSHSPLHHSYEYALIDDLLLLSPCSNAVRVGASEGGGINIADEIAMQESTAMA